MHVIGTAGHVDHGKSTLIEALTGVHPDRLKEEKQREMTIDLGFGWLSLENGQEVGIVDVPGHIDFIGNLLSGIGGIDAVLFVIAADEGIMPQTREHEAIVRLLQITDGLIVITKTDLVTNSDVLSFLKEEIRELFIGSKLETAAIVEFSAKSGKGFDALKHEISELVGRLPEKPDYGRPRLPVDRVFQLQGIGTVVTGTLQDGHFSIGDSVIVFPDEHNGRIRELQIHGKRTELAQPGNRVAINIGGIGKSEIQRGDVVTLPHIYQLTRRIDVALNTVAELSKPLAHNSHVQLFIGAKSVDARVRVLGSQQLMPDRKGFLQLEFEEPLIIMRNDRFILRYFSPGETIGGGVVLDAHPIGRHKRFQEEIINQLSALMQNEPNQLILGYLLENGMCGISNICHDLNLAQDNVLEIIKRLEAKNEVIVFNRDIEDVQKWLIAHIDYWKKLNDDLIQFLERFHGNNPLLNGAALNQIRDHLKIHEKVLENLLCENLQAGEIFEVSHHVYARKGHTITLSQKQKIAFNQASALLTRDTHKSPSIKDIAAQIGQKMMLDFIQAGLLVKISDDLIYLPEQIAGYIQWLENYFFENDQLRLAAFRDAFQTSRKYAQALLEYFDRIHVTERIEDYRVLYRNK